MMYIFRNNTIEQFFGQDCLYSGYGDISEIPDADEYVWCYQVPLLASNLVAEIELIENKLYYVIDNLHQGKPMYVFTLMNVFHTQVETGNLEAEIAVSNFNTQLYEYSKTNPLIYIINYSEFVNKCDVSKLIDWRYYYSAQMPISPIWISGFQQWWKHKLSQVKQQRKKCLILDLDNTLWQGIVGEDGIAGIQMSGDYPGKAFHYWQEGLLKLKQNGVMLAICSKNNETDVNEIWAQRSDIVLRKDDFVASRINWQDKATNIRELAKELNIGLDALVFIDDNPSERELVKQSLPDIAVPDFPKYPYELASFYQQLVENYFAVYQITDEDRHKTQQYVDNATRAQYAEAFTNLEDYLQSLEIHLHIDEISNINLPRVAQMTQKTNQFNLTTHRYTESDIQQLLSKGARGYTLSVKDKFGDSGITGCMIVTAEGIIDTFLLSCRILGKGIEEAFAKSVLIRLKELGYKQIIGSYMPTTKNAQVKDFWPRIGFEIRKQYDNGSADYEIDMQKAELTINNYYTID